MLLGTQHLSGTDVGRLEAEPRSGALEAFCMALVVVWALGSRDKSMR